MVSTPRSLPAEPSIATMPLSTSTAPLSARLYAYVLDSIVLSGFVLAFFALAGAVLWVSSDLGKEDAPDSAYYAFMGIFIGGTTVGWSAFNLIISSWRGQTAGQYVIGLRIISEDGSSASRGQTLLRWFALSPLLFHPLLVPVWALFAAITVSLTLSQLVFAVTLGLVALCLVSPVAALTAAIIDRDGRALHDRVSRTIVAQANRR